ncbi:tyrosine-type recombinase/integrase [uncultured Pseudoteredinibacter sp.]|uniref:site-specific integrase n=1 Tax=uncultured Pseudoteredinibacter sp. TaxID=1641701 RepID=UPI00262BDE7F|nr:tyrosine-type recombinase/integrase [uncultured Pseudoteredinibacter sp.]
MAKAISRFESFNKYKDFKAFHFEQAISFKKCLSRQTHHQTDEKLSLATINGACRHLKAFIQWLSQEAGYKSRIKYSDAEYFNLSEKESRTAKAKREKPVASLEQIKHVLKIMPSGNVIEKRDRALIAFTLLTGARDSAIASLCLKHVDVQAGALYQDAREVNTKFSKTFTTYFFPVGDEVRGIVSEWVNYLANDCLFGPSDPLFPKTAMKQGKDYNFEIAGLSREPWSNASAIRKIFRAAFERAGLPHFNPHSFRNTLAALGENLCHSAEEFKAWSQNLGHEGVLTTFYSYGHVQDGRQADIFNQFNEPRIKQGSQDAMELAKALVEAVSAQSN